MGVESLNCVKNYFDIIFCKLLIKYNTYFILETYCISLGEHVKIWFLHINYYTDIFIFSGLTF